MLKMNNCLLTQCRVTPSLPHYGVEKKKKRKTLQAAQVGQRGPLSFSLPVSVTLPVSLSVPLLLSAADKPAA